MRVSMLHMLAQCPEAMGHFSTSYPYSRLQDHLSCFITYLSLEVVFLVQFAPANTQLQFRCPWVVFHTEKKGLVNFHKWRKKKISGLPTHIPTHIYITLRLFSCWYWNMSIWTDFKVRSPQSNVYIFTVFFYNKRALWSYFLQTEFIHWADWLPLKFLLLLNEDISWNIKLSKIKFWHS